MADKKQVDINALITDEAVVTKALSKSTREAMKRHIAAGVPMISWEDSKVVEIPPKNWLRCFLKNCKEFQLFRLRASLLVIAL